MVGSGSKGNHNFVASGNWVAPGNMHDWVSAAHKEKAEWNETNKR